MISFKQKVIQIKTNFMRAECHNFLAFLQLTFLKMSSLNIREEYHLIRADCCTFLAFLWLAFSKINPLNNTEWYHSNKNNQNSDKFDGSRLPQLFGFSSTNLFRSELLKFCRMISFKQKIIKILTNLIGADCRNFLAFLQLTFSEVSSLNFAEWYHSNKKIIKIQTNLIPADFRNFLAFLQLTFSRMSSLNIAEWYCSNKK